MNIKAHISSSLAELQKYANAWNALADKQYDSLSVMNQWDYFKAYMSNHSIEHWYVILLSDSKDPAALLGIFPIRKLNLNLPEQNQSLHIAVCVCTRYAPYLDYLIDPDHREAVWNAAFDVMKNYLKLDGFLTAPLHQTSLNYTHLFGIFNPEGYTHLSIRNNHQIDTRVYNYDQYVKTRSRITVKNARYCERRLSKQGQLQIYYSGQPEEISQSLDFIENYMQQKYGQNLLYEDFCSMKNTLLYLSKQPCSSPGINIVNLKHEGKIIASQLLLLHRHQWIILLCAYDPEYSKHSPGKILMHHTVEEAFKQQKHFCLGAGNFDYKTHWSNRIYTLNIIACYFNTEARQAWSPYITWKGIAPFYNMG